MTTYRWLTLSAAMAITVLEVWLFSGASAAAASQLDDPTTAIVVAFVSGHAP